MTTHADIHTSVDIALAELQAIGVDVVCDAPLAPMTTYRLGGPADLLVRPNSHDELASALAILHRLSLPLAVLGGGSNMLVSDDGFRGAVLCLGRGFRDLDLSGTHITVGGAVALASVVAECRRLGLSGAECLAGIPGTVGGAVAMNAGSRERWIGEAVRTVTAVRLPSHERPVPVAQILDHDEVDWGYRTTSLRDAYVVTQVELEFAASTPAEIESRVISAISRRRGGQPAGTRNAGSVFRNPEGDSAGRLIEAANLKGVRVGGAQVSPVHANFIVAGAEATASDVFELISLVQREVVNQHGVKLTPEIRFLGQF